MALWPRLTGNLAKVGNQMQAVLGEYDLCEKLKNVLGKTFKLGD